MSDIGMPTKKRSHPFLKGWSICVDKLPKYNEFQYNSFVENISLKLARTILEEKQNDWTIIHPLTNEPYSPVMTALETKIRAFMEKNTFIKYYRVNDLGRFYAVDDKSCITLPKKIKHTLFMDAGMVDIDQEKGHARLGAGLGRMNGHTFDAIEEYIKNPTKIFNDMAEWYGIDINDKENGIKNKNRLKWYFNLTIYGGGYDNWIEGLINPNLKDIADGYEPLILKTKEKLPIMEDFKNDCRLLSSLIYKQNTQVREILEKTEEYQEKTDHEKKNAVVSYVMQILENDALYHAYKYLKKDRLISFSGRDECSLEYDGLCFKPTRKITKLDIMTLNQYVCDKTGFPVVYALKGYYNELEGDESDLSYRVYDDLIKRSKDEKDALLEKYDGLDVDLDDKDDIKYCDMKIDWEKTYCKVENEDIYFRVDGISPPAVKSETQTRKAYQHLCYGYYTKKNKYGADVVDYSSPKSFINRWLRDETIRQVKGYGMFPPPLEVPKDYINLWVNFPYQNLIAPYKYNIEAVEKFKGLILVLCNNENSSYEYLMKWLSHLFKYPAEKCGKLPVFISDEGCGKGTLMQLIKLMVGGDKYLETSQPENQVWGKFNSLMGSAYFVNLNEIGKRNQQDAEGRIKNMLTDEAMQIKGEGDKPYKISSYHRFMMSSNNDDPTNTKKGDRRKWVIHSSNELKDNTEYWCNMQMLLKDNNAVRSFYDYLMTIESEDFMKLKTPITEYQEILQEDSVDTIHMFIEWITTQYILRGYDDEGTKVDDDESSGYGYGVKRVYGSTELYGAFKAFKAEYHIHGYECTMPQLLRRLQIWSYKHEKFIIKKKGRVGNSTIFMFDELVKHFNLEQNDTDCLIKL